MPLSIWGYIFYCLRGEGGGRERGGDNNPCPNYMHFIKRKARSVLQPPKPTTSHVRTIFVMSVPFIFSHPGGGNHKSLHKINHWGFDLTRLGNTRLELFDPPSNARGVKLLYYLIELVELCSQSNYC